MYLIYVVNLEVTIFHVLLNKLHEYGMYLSPKKGLHNNVFYHQNTQGVVIKCILVQFYTYTQKSLGSWRHDAATYIQSKCGVY